MDIDDVQELFSLGGPVCAICRQKVQIGDDVIVSVTDHIDLLGNPVVQCRHQACIDAEAQAFNEQLP